MIVQLGYIGMLQLIHNFNLCPYMVQQVLSLQGFLLDLLDGIYGPRFFVPCLSDSPVGALPQCFDILKIHLEGLCLPASLNCGRQEHDPVSNFVNLHQIII